MDDSILIELECPVCTNYLSLPIRQCATGHSVCSTCFEKLKNCALCRREFTDSRNFTLEALALKVKYPCVNRDNGCEERLSYSDREKHHLKCTKQFKVSCAMKGCTFNGDPKALKEHWLSKKTLFQDVQKNVVHLVNGMYKFDLMEAFDELFWFKRGSFDEKIYFAMQYIGKPAQAENFYYELEFSRYDHSRNKLTISHSCSSIEISDEMLLSDPYYSSVAGFDTISSYVTDPLCDHLTYSLKIFRVGVVIAQPKFKKNRYENTGFVKGQRNKKKSEMVSKPNQIGGNPNQNSPQQSKPKQGAQVNRNKGRKKKEKNDTGLLIDFSE